MDSGALPVRMHCPTWQEYLQLHTEELARAELFVRTQTPAPVGTQVEVLLVVPQGLEVRLQGKVKETVAGEQPGIRVALAEPEETERARLDACFKVAQANCGQLDAEPPQPARVPSVWAPRREPSARRTASSEEARLLKSLRADLEEVGRRDDYGILGLPPTAGPKDARRAFFALSKQYHPDRFARFKDPAVKETVTEIFVIIQHAYLRLWDTAKQPSAVPPPDPKPAQPAPAQPAPTRPRAPAPANAPQPNRPRRAKPEVSAQLHLQQALKHVAYKHYDEAERALGWALSEDPNNQKASIWLLIVGGRQLKAAGEAKEALAKFQAVLELDERNAEAIREIRAIKESLGGGKGLLSRVFKRGD